MYRGQAGHIQSHSLDFDTLCYSTGAGVSDILSDVRTPWIARKVVENDKALARPI
jgi:hypothetical protein